MTQHIEEARKIVDRIHRVHPWKEACEEDIAAALAAAEERGRVEERERIGRREIHDAVSAKLVAVNEAAYGKNRGDWRHLTTNQIVDAVEALLSAAITKEPTP